MRDSDYGSRILDPGRAGQVGVVRLEDRPRKCGLTCRDEDGGGWRENENCESKS